MIIDDLLSQGYWPQLKYNNNNKWDLIIKVDGISKIIKQVDNLKDLYDES